MVKAPIVESSKPCKFVIKKIEMLRLEKDWELIVLKNELALFFGAINLENSKFEVTKFSFALFNKFGVKEDKFIKSTNFECICFKKEAFLGKEQGWSLKIQNLNELWFKETSKGCEFKFQFEK